jgi:Undecaprenyl-phosphate glucose phosphotransferase
MFCAYQSCGLLGRNKLNAMEYRYATFFKILNGLIDYLLLNLVLLTGFYFISDNALQNAVVDDWRFYILVCNLFWFFASTQVRLYEQILRIDAVPLIQRTIWALVLFSSVLLFINLVVPGALGSLELQIPFILIFSATVLIARVLFLGIRKSQRRFWVDYKKVVILGSGTVCNELFEYFNTNHKLGNIVAGYFADRPDASLPKGLHYLGRAEDAMDYATNHEISEVYCALAPSQVGLAKSLMAEADDRMIRFRFVPDLTAFLDKHVLLEYCGALPVLSARREPLQIKLNEVIKKAFDILFSSFVVAFILTWLVPIIALAIRIDSKGPIFFRQLRSGKNNKPFFCLKFRSMYVNDDADALQASKNDSRITRVGAFLRKTSLDEFPQFINVLMGDMSIVGPRPHMLKHTEEYSKVIDGFMARQFLNPGITGWAQVNGLRGETKEASSMASRVKADLWYLENWSVLLDLKIVFLTAIQSLKRNENVY